jgi:hypothetical protein
MKDDDIFLFYIGYNSAKFWQSSHIDSKYFFIQFLEVRTTTYSTFHSSLRVQVPAQIPGS